MQQIEGLRDDLLPDEEEATTPSATEAFISEAPPEIDLLLCSGSNVFVLDPEALQHPPLALRRKLFSVYCNNVDPLVKIIHRPTVWSQLNAADAKAEVSQDEAEIHAVLFAIYAAAIISLLDEDYAQMINEPKHVLLQQFRFATEYYLSKANFLESRRLVPLQAFTIYMVCARL